MRIRAAIGTAACLVAAFAATAAAADAPTLTSSAGMVQFGSGVTLQGLAPGQAGQTVQVFATGCGFVGSVPVGTATIGADGTYSLGLEPALGMTFVAAVGDAQSAPLAIRVQPLVQLRRVGPKLFGVDVSVGAGQFFTSKATLQRYETKHKRWLPVAAGALQQKSSFGDVVAVSSATIRAAVKPGTRLRAFVGQAALGTCYAPASSIALTA
jgi:hypothetical protein